MNYGPELIAALVDELKEYCGHQLQKVEGGGTWCLLGFKGRSALFLTWAPQTFGICSLPTSDVREMKAISSKTPLSQSLQKYLINSSLISVYNTEGDRVITFTFRKFVGGGQSKDTKFILELTGRMSNAILTDADGVIIEAGRHIYPDVNRYRSIIPGTKYIAPPPIKGTMLTPYMNSEELAEALKKPKGIGYVLANLLSSVLEDGYEELVKNAIFKTPKIFQSICNNYLTAAGEELPGTIVFKKTGLDICHEYIAGEIKRKTLDNIAQRAKKILDRSLRAKARHVDGLKSQIEKGENCDQYRIAGEAILQNMGTLKDHCASARLKYWDDEGEKEVLVTLNPLLNAQNNAKNYFKKYQKFHTDVNEVKDRLKKLEDELEDIRALISNLGKVDSVENLNALCEQVTQQYAQPLHKVSAKKPKKTFPPHLKFTIGDSVILVGMNEKGNRYVTFQEASPDDLWFHVHERPGAHVILKNPPADEETLEKCIQAAASLALFYSTSDRSQAVIDYTFKKHVRHIQGAGPANVTYKFPSTILVSSNQWKSILCL